MKNGKIVKDGSQYWYKDGELHREDGPAVIYPDGTEFWYINGKSHREAGPARIYPDGTKYFFLNGQYLEEEKWWKSLSDECKEKALFRID